MKKYLYHSGQSLFELVIALGVAVLIIAGLTVTTLVGLRNSQYSQNQIQASKIAQEGIEKIRAAREKDQAICQSPQILKWNTQDNNGIWSTVFNPGASTIFYFSTDSLSPDCFITSNAAAPNVAAEKALQGKFSRIVYIYDNGSGNSKDFTVKVQWADYSGIHEANLRTTLANIDI